MEIRLKSSGLAALLLVAIHESAYFTTYETITIEVAQETRSSRATTPIPLRATCPSTGKFTLKEKPFASVQTGGEANLQQPKDTTP
jgi:hypothetical protein